MYRINYILIGYWAVHESMTQFIVLFFGNKIYQNNYNFTICIVQINARFMQGRFANRPHQLCAPPPPIMRPAPTNYAPRLHQLCIPPDQICAPPLPIIHPEQIVPRPVVSPIAPPRFPAPTNYASRPDEF
jgi:hypothetical protein